MKSTLTLAFIIVFQLAFGQKHVKIIFPPPVLGMDVPDFISACELPTHKKELVYTRFIYSGIDEYWGLRPEKKCNTINAELTIPDSVEIKVEDLKQLQNVHEHYWKQYLIIDAIGTFEDESKTGYGHLSSNNSRFVVKYIINIQTITKNTKIKKRG